MHAQTRTPVLIAALIAIAGSAVILVNNFSPYQNPQDLARADRDTAAAVSRAGAFETPSAVTF